MKRLRVGLLIGHAGPRAWHEQIFELLAEHEAVDLVGLFSTPNMGMRHEMSWRWLDRLETVFAHKLFRTARADLPLPIDRQHVLPPRRTIDDLQVTEIDLLLCLDGSPNGARMFERPKHGVWHLTVDGREQSDDRLGLSAWYEGRHTAEVTLWRTDDGHGAPTIIERAHLGIFKPSWSVSRSRHLWRMALLVTDNVIRLATQTNHGKSRAGVETSAAQPSSDPSTFLLGLRSIRRIVNHVWRKLVYVEQWQVLATRSSGDRLKPKAYARLQPPRDRFWADPFAVQRAGKDYIFVEELRFKANRGEIAVLEHRDGELLDARTIIAEPYHMSYPHIVEHGGDLFMVPETRQKRTIDIWKNTSFPDQWTRAGSLMEDVSAGDTTLFRHDGRWWMFTNLSRTKHLRSADELHAFYTDETTPLTKAWQPHRLNPLVRDTRFARQGGRVHVDEEGRLIRCAQDTAVRYGYAVLFFHVEDLTPTSFAETLLHKVEPDWHDDVVGMHTFERSGDLSVFDACFVRPRLRALL